MVPRVEDVAFPCAFRPDVEGLVLADQDHRQPVGKRERRRGVVARVVVPLVGLPDQPQQRLPYGPRLLQGPLARSDGGVGEESRVPGRVPWLVEVGEGKVLPQPPGEISPQQGRGRLLPELIPQPVPEQLDDRLIKAIADYPARPQRYRGDAQLSPPDGIPVPEPQQHAPAFLLAPQPVPFETVQALARAGRLNHRRPRLQLRRWRGREIRGLSRVI